MSKETFKSEPGNIACQMCRVPNKETSCEVKCESCGKIFAACYMIDNKCWICNSKEKKK